MKIKRPVQVKVVLTEQSKCELEAEYQERLDQLKLEQEQLRFQGRKILHDAGKKGTEQVRVIQERLRQEEKKRKEQLEQVEYQIDQLRLLPVGTEILHSTIDSEVEIKVGDNWEDIMKSCEIVIKDGVVYEIRERRDIDG